MEVCSALAFLHACKPHSIVHRDLKPGNILLDAPPMSKLSDFGICRLLSGGDWLTHNTTVLYPTYPKGTFGYMDPEFLVKRELTTKFDAFSFGITLLQLLTRRPALGKANVVQRATSAGILEAMLDPLAGERPYMVTEESTHLVLSCCEMSRRNKLDPRRVGSAPMERSFQGVSTKPVTPVPEDRIYVAVGKNMKKSKANLAWALHQSGGKVKTCIIHVLVPTQAIPMGGLGVKIPANSANEIMLREHRENEGINMHKILDTYLVVCQKMRVPVEKEYVESNIVQKGFVELIRLHGIRKLVMSGAAARRHFKYVQEQTTYLSENREVSRLHITRKVTVGSAAANLHFRNMAEIKSRKAIFFRYKAHSSCPFICHRDPPSLTTSTPGAGNSILLESQSATLQRSGRAKLSNPFRDILKRAFSSAYRCEAMPIASPSPDSIPSVQPSATGIVKRQETSKKSEGFQRVLPIVGIRFSQTSSSADFLLTLKKMKEVLEMTEDHLDTVMEKLRAAQAQKSQLKDQFVETVRMNSFGIRTLMRDLLMQGLSVLHPLDSIGHLRSRLRLSMGDRGSAGFLETINGLGDQESLHLSDFTHLNSLSDTVGELRRTTELYLSGTANREQEMEEMQFDHALQLFSEHAFHTDLAPCDLYDLSRQVVELTGGLPLAVEVIGSHLRTTSKAKWKTTLKKLKELPYEKVRQRLQISYDALGCEGQQIFLDIGCFFVNQKKANAMYMWEARDFYPEVETDILIRKSLIKIHDDRILMHGQLRDLAREIISQENIRNCGHRSRLWFLEMSLAQKVSEEVERAISRFLDPSLRALSIPVGTIEECSLRLQFVTKLSATIFTSSQIEAEDGTPLRIKLVDGRTKERVTSGLLSLLKLDIVLLKHVFGSDEGEDWTVKDFNGNIIREREGKRPLITGELPVVLQGGIGCLRNLIITDNSSWMRSRKFRLGARAVQKVSAETRILEALSETFIVKDHRGELSKKHHPPSLSDEVWRLEKVAKGGALHECITSRRINTVQDFLQLYKANASSLRNILGTGIANQIWETIIRHASTCVLDDNKMYSYYPASNKTGILFNLILKVVQATLDGQTYELLEKLTQSQKNLKWQAYNNKNQWVPLDALPSITPPRALTNLHTEPLVVVSPPPSHHLDYTVLNQDGREVTPEFNYSFGFSTALLQCHREQTI